MLTSFFLLNIIATLTVFITVVFNEHDELAE